MNLEKIQQHYEHAREKHPYFCDKILPSTFDKDRLRRNLDFIRNHLREQGEQRNVHFGPVLECEVMEIWDAMINRTFPDAVEEAYDAIAVLLRLIDVLEGRQKLGQPENQGEQK